MIIGDTFTKDDGIIIASVDASESVNLASRYGFYSNRATLDSPTITYFPRGYSRQNRIEQSYEGRRLVVTVM
jgi:hypothetical protein